MYSAADGSQVVTANTYLNTDVIGAGGDASTDFLTNSLLLVGEESSYAR
jgi:hypothetical protein